jgi:hypothetical protein
MQNAMNAVLDAEKKASTLHDALLAVANCIDMADAGADMAGLPNDGACRRHLAYAAKIIEKAVKPCC